MRLLRGPLDTATGRAGIIIFHPTRLATPSEHNVLIMNLNYVPEKTFRRLRARWFFVLICGERKDLPPLVEPREPRRQP